MKAKLKGAETGHSLLKRKSEALTKYAPLHGPIPHFTAEQTEHATNTNPLP
jgi:hypothetical protein